MIELSTLAHKRIESAKIQNAVDKFLSSGGKINVVPFGIGSDSEHAAEFVINRERQASDGERTAKAALRKRYLKSLADRIGKLGMPTKATYTARDISERYGRNKSAVQQMYSGKYAVLPAPVGTRGSFHWTRDMLAQAEAEIMIKASEFNNDWSVIQMRH